MPTPPRSLDVADVKHHHITVRTDSRVMEQLEELEAHYRHPLQDDRGIRGAIIRTAIDFLWQEVQRQTGTRPAD